MKVSFWVTSYVDIFYQNLAIRYNLASSGIILTLPEMSNESRSKVNALKFKKHFSCHSLERGARQKGLKRRVCLWTRKRRDEQLTIAGVEFPI
jgi:hypothetical protein